MKTRLLRKLRNEAKKRYVLEKNCRSGIYRLFDTKDKFVLVDSRCFGFVKKQCDDYRRELILKTLKSRWRTLKY